MTPPVEIGVVIVGVGWFDHLLTDVITHSTEHTDMPEFASLESLDVRQYWEHEEYDFTPWLADEIGAEGASDLEDVLGLDMEVIEREKSVGKYKVDIYARVVDDGRSIVIENQLDGSNHDHLGKAIAYAAGVDADIIVWLTPEFNDEHRDAMQWLNENTREGVDLFAIRLEVWKIGSSPPAVRFNAVEQPSEWKEKAQRSRGELSDRDKLREEFWTAFRDRIEDTKTPLSSRKPYPSHYYSNPIGIGGYHMSFHIDESEEELALELIFEDDAEGFEQLRDRSEELEAELGVNLYWGELRETRTGKMRSELGVKRNADIENRDQWDEYFDWMLKQGKRFHDVFPERLRQL